MVCFTRSLTLTTIQIQNVVVTPRGNFLHSSDTFRSPLLPAPCSRESACCRTDLPILDILCKGSHVLCDLPSLLSSVVSCFRASCALRQGPWDHRSFTFAASFSRQIKSLVEPLWRIFVLSHFTSQLKNFYLFLF